MTLAEDFWLRSQAAQASMMQFMAYNTAFAGTATLQAWKLGLSAPVGFWQALGRAGGVAANATDNVVALDAPVAKAAKTAKAAKKATVKPTAKPKAVSKPKAVAKPKLVASTPAPVREKKPKKAKKNEAAPSPAPVPVDLGPSPHLLDAPRGGKADDLTVLSGVGTKLATSLNEFGIYHFDQIATLDADGIDWLNEQQPGFKMIAARYKVVDQARARLPN